MKYQEFRMEMRPQGLYIESGYLRFTIGCFQQNTMQYDMAVRWCRETGGQLPTLEQALIICENHHKINNALKAAGHSAIGEYLWTRRKHPLADGAVYAVNMSNGNIDRAWKGAAYNTARSIITFAK